MSAVVPTQMTCGVTVRSIILGADFDSLGDPPQPNKRVKKRNAIINRYIELEYTKCKAGHLSLIIMAMKVAVFLAILLSASTVIFGTDYKRLNDDEIKAIRTSQHIVVINFWATWCQACKNEIPILNMLHKKFTDAKFFGINVDDRENRGAIKGFLKKNPIEYEIFLRDGKDFASLASTFQEDWKSGLPATFVYLDGKQIFDLVGELKGGELNYILQMIPR
jgi:thiol-disulfide isomerase/thioredoxin